MLQEQLNGNPATEIDFYAMEEPWTLANNPYEYKAEGNCIKTAQSVFAKAFNQ